MYRFILAIFLIAVPFNLDRIIILNNNAVLQDKDNKSDLQSSEPFIGKDYSKLRDTLYTTHNYYVEINLKKQLGYLYGRDGLKHIFKLSSGTDRIKDGIKTREGVFVVQEKNRKRYSKEFETWMLKWMGFNYGIGMHALYGNSYYKYLGRNTASHGCIRLSREDADFIFSRVKVGTPVLVHSENNVVSIGFTDSTNTYFRYSNEELSDLVKNRLAAIYNKRYFLEAKEKLLVDFSNITHFGLPLGNVKKVPYRQLIFVHYFKDIPTTIDQVK
ncbi:MAG: L,D-transpeptidase [Ignavibacteriales bacterium]|nr:L,D-transpeptidase [Ignavibacteriales bacterium]